MRLPAEGLPPRTLRGRLTLAIAAITLLVAAGTYAAIDRGAVAELQGRIDEDLRAQAREWELFATRRHPPSTPEELTRAAYRFIASQQYHPRSRVFLFEIAGAPSVSNEPELAEEADEGDDDLELPLGLTTADLEEVGRARVLSVPIERGGRTVAVLRVADPLASVEDARAGIRANLLAVAVAALVLAVAAAAWIAAVTARPLRRMARFAADVEAGDLSPRLGRVRAGEEVRALAAAFDRMLDRLQAAFTRQREFVSDASHELRTPLTILRGQIELLARPEIDAATREATMAVVTRELGRMSALVDDLLTLASAEAGQLIEVRDVDVGDFVDDIARDLPLFGPRRYRAEGRPEGRLRADPERLTQVVRNIVRNAVAHTGPEDEVVLAVQAAGDVLEIAVADSGRGIPQDELERVFERFHRAPGSASAGGAGLGLAIARAIVEAHGGRIRAESRAGGGTVVRFTLPGYRPPSA